MAKLLSPDEELGLPWDEWADGKIRRLKKGKDFTRSARAIEEAAQNAAARLKKVVRSQRDLVDGSIYVWVQFTDEIAPGKTCRCGSVDIRRVSSGYARCGNCDAILTVPEKTQDEEVDADSGSTNPEGVAEPASDAAPREQKRRPATISKFSDVELFRYDTTERLDRYYGRAVSPNGQRVLVLVDFILEDGDRVEDPNAPGEFLHTVRAIPADPFGSIVDLGAFERAGSESGHKSDGRGG